jgi:hypothetical protein
MDFLYGMLAGMYLTIVYIFSVMRLKEDRKAQDDRK